MAVAAFALAAVLSLDVLAVFKVDEGPELRVGAEDDVAAPAPVTSVGPALRDVFSPVKVRRSSAAVPGCAEYLYVIYEVAVCHIAAKIRFFGEIPPK